MSAVRVCLPPPVIQQMIMDIEKSANVFLDRLFQALVNSSISLDGLQIDHIAYRTETSDEYNRVKLDFEKYGEYLPDAEIRGRRIAVLKLHSPLKYKKWSIEAVEILEPASNNRFKSGWEHIEVVSRNLNGIIDKYPSLNWDKDSMDRKNNPELTLRFDIDLAIRFHPISIIEARKLQVETGEL